MSRNGRLRRELSVWRMAWKQVDTFIDRLEGAQEDDAPDAWVCAVSYEALEQLEGLRLRRDGWRLRSGLPPAEPSHADPGNRAGGDPWPPVAPSRAHTELSSERDAVLPDTLDIELAVAPLHLPDGEVSSPPEVGLVGSTALLTVSHDRFGARLLNLPHYDFGLVSGQGPLVPGRSDLSLLRFTLEISEDGDVGYMPLPRRRTAAEEGFADAVLYSAERQRRLTHVRGDPALQLEIRGDSPTLDELSELLLAEDFEGLADALEPLRDAAEQGATHLTKVAARAELEEVDEELVATLRAVQDRLQTEHGALASLVLELQSDDPPNALAVFIRLVLLPHPDDASTQPHVQKLLAEMDRAVAARVTGPDGSLHQVRALELGLLGFWHARRPWFAHRRRTALAPLLRRFLARFRAGYAALLSGQGSLPQSWHGLEVQRAVAASSTQLPLSVTRSEQKTRLRELHAGQVLLLGGTRPTPAVVLDGQTGDVLRLRTLPLRPSMAHAPGLEGVPGLIPQGTSVVASVPAPDAASLSAARDLTSPERNGVVHTTLALWSRLALLQGRGSVPTPPGLDFRFKRALHIPPDAPLSARAPLLVLPTTEGLLSGGRPRFAPGELLLLSGRTAEGWVRGVVEVAQAEVTTLEALDIPPETDPSSPVCCTSSTPVVALRLAQNSVSEPLISDAWLTRDFVGFSEPALAIGIRLPSAIDGDYAPMRVEGQGAALSFEEGPGTEDAPELDREMELDFAARMLDEWVRQG